jgi:hypothetical protein
MKRAHRLGAGVVASLVLALPARAQLFAGDYPTAENYRLRLEYREYRPSLSGDVQKGFGDDEGTLVDVEDDLGFADDRTFEARATIQIARGHKLRASYTPLEYAGNVARARRTFTFGQTTYERFTQVVSTFKGGYYAGAYEWDFVKGSKGYLGAFAGGAFLDFDATLVAVEANAREQEEIRSPVPLVGATARVYSGRLSLQAELSGISAGSRGKIIEVEASARLHLSDRLAAMGGYRSLAVDGRDGRDRADLRLKGWQFGIEIGL